MHTPKVPRLRTEHDGQKFSQGAKTTSRDQTERFPVRLCDLHGERGPPALLTGPSFARAFQDIELLAR